VSEHTVKFHVRSLLDKLGADTRADAVARAARRGLLTL
jgi:DNA-binding CsgD family transcriptional regulator